MSNKPRGSTPSPLTDKHPIATAELEWRNETTPLSTEFDDVYFSVDDGAAESRYVFLDNNNLQARFTALFESRDKSHFSIAETGFGTGLNFLQCCQLWKSQQQQAQSVLAAHKKLYFISTEIRPLSQQDLRKSLACWPDAHDISEQLLSLYPPAIAGMHTLELSHGITLILIFGDAVEGLQQLQDHPHPHFPNASGRHIDAWFLDGFAPSKNADMWSSQLFETMASLSQRDSSFATFTAAGIVKRGLRQAGFRIKKVAGFGRKRDMLIGQYQGLPNIVASSENDKRQHLRSHDSQPFWPIHSYYDSQRTANTESPNRSVIVIGAGIAGCTTALSLAEAGMQVTLIDQHQQPMQEASGNMQGVLFPKLSHQQGDLAQFNLFSYLYALRFYQRSDMQASFFPSGMLQLIDNNKSDDASKLMQRFSDMPSLVQKMSAEEASVIANTHIPQPCIWYPGTGWFRQSTIEQLMLDKISAYKNLRFIPATRVKRLQRQTDGAAHWTIHCEPGNAEASAAHKSFKLDTDTVVICTAFASNTLLASIEDAPTLSPQLPLKNIRGQITQVANTLGKTLATTICHSGYITPTDPLTPELYNFGASYEHRDNCHKLKQSSHTNNIEKLCSNLPDFKALAEQTLPLRGRVAFRCTTPDYLPIIGPVANHDEFCDSYAGYRKDAKAYIPVPGRYYPGLMLNIGLGSRGFASAPIAAAIIRAYCLQQPFPVDKSLLKAVNPARFLIRDIIRNKV